MERRPIDAVEVLVLRIPTDAPEADGTATWDHTGMVLVEIHAGGQTGLGFTYGSPACAEVIRHTLAEVVQGENAFDLPKMFQAMERSLRNLGRPGVGTMALSAMDVALWDLKARLLGISLPVLWGRCREAVPIYGSGGFTSYSVERLQEQLGGWAKQGIRQVKMKIGADPSNDLARIEVARDAIGDAELFVDANGALHRKDALALAEFFPSLGVTWFEEPVSSDDREGLRLLRDRMPGGVRVAAGEYAYTRRAFLDLLQGGCVDVLQADATRCGGFTGFFAAAALARAFHLPLSAHTSPALHAVVGTAVPDLENVEWFHDHVRIEDLFFSGLPELRDGALVPDPSRPGHGLSLRRDALTPYLA